MITKTLTDQLREKINHLDLTEELLNHVMHLRDNLSPFVSASQTRLNTELMKEPQNSDETINALRERFDSDLSMRINCEVDIVKYQTHLEAAKKEIQDLQQRLNKTTHEKAQASFFSSTGGSFDESKGKHHSSTFFNNTP